MMDQRELMAPSVCRIEAIYPDGSVGTGTSFFHVFNLSEDKLKGALCLITNKHVISGADKLRFFFCGKTSTGERDGKKTVVAEFSSSSVFAFYHEDGLDLAVIPIIPIIEAMKAQNLDPYYIYGTSPTNALNEMQDELGSIENIHLVGYPIGIYDTANNQPIIRSGITATPFELDYLGKPEFLIDCACFPGSSGSPVYLANYGTLISKKTGAASFGYQFSLLGILRAGPMYNAQGEIEINPVPTSLGTKVTAKIPINLGICIKATELDKFEPLFKNETLANGKSLADLDASLP